MIRKTILVGTLVLCSVICSAQDMLDLSGEWRFGMDERNAGIEERWYERVLPGSIRLPGSMATNGLGYAPGLDTKWTGTITEPEFLTDPANAKYVKGEVFKVPFWFVPEKYYVGPAWYGREVEIPDEWRDDVVELFIERSHFQTAVWVNGVYLGECNSLGTPHRFDITRALNNNDKCRIVCRVDNRLDRVDVGINAHSVTDHTQTNWNGMIGRIELRRIPKVHIEDIQIYPDVKNRSAKVVAILRNEGNKAVRSTLMLRAEADTGEISLEKLSRKVRVEAGSTTEVRLLYPMGDSVLLWDEFSPHLYTMRAELNTGKKGIHRKSVRFGMREFASEGRRFTINGRPVMLRGTLECAIFPLTGYPMMTVDEWVKIFRKCKDFGMNHMRFHSWCPPHAAFVAADSLGMYLQVECGSWAFKSVTLGDGLPVDDYTYAESRRIVREYGNHPSFCLMAYGNEPHGDKREEFLKGFVRYWQNSGDHRRLYTSGAGWPVLDSVCDYNNTPRPRLQGTARRAEINKNPPSSIYNWNKIVKQWNKPTISHEIGQWCVYPDFSEIDRYTGPLKARNYEIYRDRLEENGLLPLAEKFKMASGKLQLLCYKAEVEAALRTRELAGFQVLDLRDFPGQGTAPIGVLNTLWEEKGYATATDYSRFCNAVVPLALFPKMIYENDEMLAVKAEVSNFGGCSDALPASWRIIGGDGRIVASGHFDSVSRYGSCIPLGEIRVSLSQVTEPSKLTLSIRVGAYENDWGFFVFPKQTVPDAGQVMVCDRLDSGMVQKLIEGARVLVTLRKGTLSKEMGGEIRFGFSPIFWNTVWVNKDVPYTMGILCDPNHPALAGFPTDYHSDWQWWDASTNGQPIELKCIGKEIEPIVRVIDGWSEARSLGLLFEARVGMGKIMVSGIDLLSNQESRVEARALLGSLLAYMNSERFNPTATIDPSVLLRLTLSQGDTNPVSSDPIRIVPGE